MKKTTRILALTAVAVVATAGGIVAGQWMHGGDSQLAQAATPSNAAAVNHLWTASVTNPDGQAASLAAFQGHVTVVNFWASWCGPCVQEMPELSALQRQYEKKGIRFVGLGVDSNQNVKTFLQKVQVAYPIYVVGFGGADLAREFGNNAGALPFTVVIDAKGQIRSTKLGQIKPDELKQTLDSL